MRKELFGVGSFVHVFNRGNRKQEIVRDEKDRWNFLQMLYYFNSEYSPPNPMRTLKELLKLDFNTRLVWPSDWPERKQLVNLHAFILKDNHFHLVLEETTDGGVTKFMQKLGTGMTNRFNTRHKETGRLFQGSYKARLIDDENYFRYLFVYLHIKNAFEMYPGGIGQALEHFDDAYDFAVQYPYSSLAHYMLKSNFNTGQLIADDGLFHAAFPDQYEIQKFAKDCLSSLAFDEQKCLIPVESLD